MGYAFISYSSKNQSVANSMRSFLNQEGIETWMAPGDIPAGSHYAEVINRALKECACFILMLSEDAQKSIWIAKEIERALSYKKTIIPVQIENVVLNDEFEMYISTNQIIAIQKIDRNSIEIKNLLSSIISLTNPSELIVSDNPKADSDKMKLEVEQQATKKTNSPESSASSSFDTCRFTESIPLPSSQIDMRKRDSIFSRYSSSFSNKANIIDIKIGSFVSFGHYQQKRNTLPYLEYEYENNEIEWIVLKKEDDHILVVSKHSLDFQPYDTHRKKDWLNCSLHKWLNDDFSFRAFNDSERRMILNNANNDSVFLLSAFEVEKYFPFSATRKCKPTEYAESNNPNKSHDNSHYWWVSLYSDSSRNRRCVDIDGNFNYCRLGKCCGIRPAIRIKLKAFQ